jgi:polysaccharide export outer membrane protein
VLGPDDQVAIHAIDVPDISDKPQRLDPNGDLNLPMVGRVHAAGMTLEQLREELTRRLKVYLVEPDVAIAVTEFRSQPVSVIGAVGTSGVRQLEGRKTLVEVLSLAGGVSADAGPSVRVTRRLESGRIPLPEATEDTSGGFSVAEIDLKSLLKATNPEKNIAVRPYDIISIPRAELVYVVGEVAKPGALPLTGGPSVSIMEAVSASGGILRTAAPTHARIVRRIAGGAKRAELTVDLKKITQGKADDLPLVAGDILFVPDSNGKRVAARAIEAAIQVGLLVGTYGVIR